jgi:hypothetical protein
MRFFTDAYDLFVIGIASSLIMADWHLSPASSPGTMLKAAFLDAGVRPFRRPVRQRPG